MNPAAAKALEKAKLNVMIDPMFTFFTNVMLSLRHEWTTSLPTAGTDGVGIYYNPDYFMSLTTRVQKTLPLHEVGHVVLDHINRKGSRNHKKYNRAGDYVINAMLKHAGCELGPGWLYDPIYDGMTTEQVYNLLPDDPMDDFDCDIMPSPLPAKEAQDHLDSILVRASIAVQQAGKGWGCVPDEVKTYLDKLLNPRLSWFALLRRYYYGFQKLDYTFRKPNRRFFPDHILPTAHSEALDTVAEFVDVSGSILDHQYLAFVSEAMNVIRTQKPRELKFIQFDTRIISVDTVTTVREMENVQFRKGGGTNITPVIEWINKHKPAISIIFTDGEFAKPTVTTKQPIIWVIYGDEPFTAPFGKVVNYHFDD